MKFIHTADIHWGMIPDSDKPWGRERSQAIKETFNKIIQIAQQEEIDCLFISGDLFHQQPLTKDLKDLNYLFTTIPRTHVVIIAGSHDRIRKSSALLSFTWSSNVTFFMDETISSVYFEDINTEVHGFSYHTSEVHDARLDSLRAPVDERIHILLAYGGNETHLPFDINQLTSSGFSYIGLGYQHKHEILRDNLIAYSGSPEPLSKVELGQHGIIIGDINPQSNTISSMEFVPISKTQYIPLVIYVTTKTTNKELSQRLISSIEERGEQNIYRLRIRGMRRPDTRFNLEKIISTLRIIDIVDESEPQYDFTSLLAEHPGDMIGFYIQSFQKPNMSIVERKALYYGINALLQTIDERSQT